MIWASASILQADAGVCGGITEWRRIAAMAASNNVAVAPHWLAEVHGHMVASTPNAVWVEYFTDVSVINLSRLFSTRLEVRPGGLALPQIAGLGVKLDAAAVKRYSVDGWA
ncbi:MAG: enolase C-terminal domain-like protein [Candidatus Methylomirabilia bacterium]